MANTTAANQTVDKVFVNWLLLFAMSCLTSIHPV